MKFNKFLLAGATVAVLSFGVQAQEAPTNTQQGLNPTVAKTLNTFGGFLGSIVQNAQAVVESTANGVKNIANSEGGQNLKNGVVKGAKFVSTTATDGAQSVAKGFKEANENANANRENASRENNDLNVEAASVVSVSQPVVTPSIAEGFETAKGKIGGMINFLRDKAISRDVNNTNTNDTPKMN